MKRLALAIAICVALPACSGQDVDKPGIPTPAQDEAAAIVQPSSPETPPEAPETASAPEPQPEPASVPPGVLYVCVRDAAGPARQSPIEFAPRVAALCRKAPEMGPCRYEREACRRSGGRVFTADAGIEITLSTEADYDKRVLRVRMKSN
jgi:hypothetical protein